MLLNTIYFTNRRRHVLKNLKQKQKRRFLRVSLQEKVQWVSMSQIWSKTLEISCLPTLPCISTKRRYLLVIQMIYSTNSVKDYINIAGPYGVTHIILFNKGKTAPRMRIGCFPQGPTLHFRVCFICLVHSRWKSTL